MVDVWTSYVNIEMSAMEETGDRGGEPEGDTEWIRELQAAKRERYERVMKRRGLDPDLSDREYLEGWKKELGVK